MEYLTEANGWMKPSTPIRRGVLCWAADAEPAAARWPAGTGHWSLQSVMDRLASDLPELVDAP